MDPQFALHRLPFVGFAHRGASGHAPENTLDAFDTAIRLQAQWVELDVHEADGELVVIHDRKLERTTDGKGVLADHTFEALRLLDAGNGQTIPTLREVIEAIDHRAGINIELKGEGAAAPASDLVASLLTSGWDLKEFLFSSFTWPELATVRRRAPNASIGVLASRDIAASLACCEELDAFSLHVSMRQTGADLVQEAHARGLRVYTYTANTIQELQRVMALEVDGVFSNYPDRVTAALRDTGRAP